ncbi:protein of unknown function [Arachidicoccus rhizosphaerae]|jgi:hypothetical protein|uniref:eCIS core domain-containing protein n=1 Tax=Arachidicoccus rhizosphaerae TaxID=551991 RepID=A0A1H3Z8G9_9BACT|nr:DUF4157 domain-containing protein [Arachidicoccus rhizosphaerae]SEA19957.1 protein of unknown function [Arachidicoccus rhizosphaerae]
MELVPYTLKDATLKELGKTPAPHKTRIRIRQNSWIAKMACWCIKEKDVAFTLFRTIHLSHSTPRVFLNNQRWVAHELAHVRQFATYGNVKFIFMYLSESFRNGYHNNKWEVEARANEDSVDILQDYYFEYTS